VSDLIALTVLIIFFLLTMALVLLVDRD